ncbi:MAG: hypothetical protein U0Y10_19020 [Spirosomataceae bacterium]
MKKQRIRLEDLEKKEVFQVPDRYFDDLPMVIQARIAPKAKAEPLFTFSWNTRRTWLSVSTVSLVALLIWITYPARQDSLGEGELSKVSSTEIINYLNQQNISSQDLADETTVRIKKQVYQDVDSLMMENLDITPQDIIQHLDPEDVKDVI